MLLRHLANTADPRTWDVPPGLNALVLITRHEPDSPAGDGGPFEIRPSDPGAIEAVEIRAGTMLPSLDFLKAELTVHGWRGDDASELRSSTLQKLILVKGTLTNFTGLATPRLADVHCALLPRLRSLAGLACDTLVVEGCRKLDHATVVCVRGLVRLRLQQQPALTDWSFLSRSPSLEQVVLTATGHPTDGLADALRRTPALRRVHLSKARNELLAEASRQLPAVILSNDKAEWRNGERHPLSDRQWAVYV